MQGADLSFTLPWPAPVLSPNVPGHWAIKAKAKKAYRAACKRVVDTSTATAGCLPPDAVLRVWLCFRPPNARKRDMDNLVACMKSGLDGLADGLSVDDSMFRLTIEYGPPVVGGAVEVEVLVE